MEPKVPPTSGDPISRRVQEHNIAMPGVLNRSAGESTARRLSRFGVGDGRLAERVRGRWIMAKEPGVQATDLPFVRGKFVTDLPESGISDPGPIQGPQKDPANAPESQPLQVVTGRRISGQSGTGQSGTGQSMHDSAPSLSAAASPGVMRSQTNDLGAKGIGRGAAGEFTTEAGAEASPSSGLSSAAGTMRGENSFQSGATTAPTTHQAGSAGQSGTEGDVVQRVGTDHPLSRELGEPAPASLPFVRPMADAGIAGQVDMPVDALQRAAAEGPLAGDSGTPAASSMPMAHLAPDTGTAGQHHMPADVLQRVSAESELSAAASIGSGDISSSGAPLHSLPVVRAQRWSAGPADPAIAPGTPADDTGATAKNPISVQRAAAPGAANEGFQRAAPPSQRLASASSGMPAVENQRTGSESHAQFQQLSPQTNLASAEQIASRAIRWGTPIVQRRSSTQGQSSTTGADDVRSTQPSTQPSPASRQGAESGQLSPTAAMPVGIIGRSVESARDNPQNPIVHTAARPSVAKSAAPEGSHLDVTASGMAYGTDTPLAANTPPMPEVAGQPALSVQRVTSAPQEPSEQADAASLPLVAPTKGASSVLAETAPIAAGSTGTPLTGSVQPSSLANAGQAQTQIGAQPGAAPPHLRVQRAENTPARPSADLHNTGSPQTSRLSPVTGPGPVLTRAAESGAPGQGGVAATVTSSGAGDANAPSGKGSVARIRRAPAIMSDVAGGFPKAAVGNAMLRAKHSGASRSSGLPINVAVQPGQPGTGRATSEIGPYRATALLQAQPEPPVHGELSPAGSSISGGLDTPLPLRRETTAGNAAGFEAIVGQVGADGDTPGAFRTPAMPVMAAAVGRTGLGGITQVQRQSSASSSASSISSASPASSASSGSAASTAAPPSSGADQGAQRAALDERDLERVATAVYGIIRDRLIVERESRGL